MKLTLVTVKGLFLFNFFMSKKREINMSRKKSREYVFRLVFEKFFHEPDKDIVFEDEDFDMKEVDREFVDSLFSGIENNFDSILEIIKNNVSNYEIDRIYKVDLSILVVAVYELKFDKSTEQNIVINEAIELSKKYSTDKSYSFINGVIAKIINN